MSMSALVLERGKFSALTMEYVVIFYEKKISYIVMMFVIIF